MNKNTSAPPRFLSLPSDPEWSEPVGAITYRIRLYDADAPGEPELFAISEARYSYSEASYRGAHIVEHMNAQPWHYTAGKSAADRIARCVGWCPCVLFVAATDTPSTSGGDA
jgi:hypothetical protein